MRVWGGGLFEKFAFYDECDKQGILICHDFLMACGEYPEKEEWFINELLLESEYAVKFLRNHPALAWFHGDNENAVDGSDLSPDYTGRNSALDGIFPSIYKYSKNIPFLASSPWGGNMFNSITSGTSHNTNFVGETFKYMHDDDCSSYKEYFSQFTTRFLAEEPTFGAICRESMLEFMTEDDLTGEDESILKYHSKTNPALPTHIYDDNRAFAEKGLGEFTDGEDRYFKMKYIQCEWVRITYELVLRNLGYSNGLIYWMFNDCWPASIGWAFVDYYRRRKPSYYAFKRLSTDVTASIDIGTEKLAVTNVANEPRAAELTVHLLDMKDGLKEIETVKTSVGLGAYSTAAVDISDKLNSDILAVIDVESEGEAYRSYYKTGRLEIAESEAFSVLESNGESVTIKAHSYLQAVELEGDYSFSDNYFTMLDGEVKTVTLENFSEKAKGVSVKTYTIK